MEELYSQTSDFLGGEEDLKIEQFQHRIAFNCIPHIDMFLEDGFHQRGMENGRRDEENHGAQ